MVIQTSVLPCRSCCLMVNHEYVKTQQILLFITWNPMLRSHSVLAEATPTATISNRPNGMLMKRVRRKDGRLLDHSKNQGKMHVLPQSKHRKSSNTWKCNVSQRENRGEIKEMTICTLSAHRKWSKIWKMTICTLSGHRKWSKICRTSRTSRTSLKVFYKICRTSRTSRTSLKVFYCSVWARPIEHRF